MNLELQRKLLADQIRNTAFIKAIKNTIEPEHTVIDLGAGTGFLGFQALKQGAKKVIFIEHSPILQFAVEMAKKLGVYERCTFLEFHSNQTTLNIKADIIICETLGTYAFEENILENWQDALAWSHKTTLWLPKQIELYAFPITNQTLHHKIDVWYKADKTLPWETLRHHALSRPYAEEIKPDDTVFAPTLIGQASPTKLPTYPHNFITKWPCSEPTLVYGFGLFWTAFLDDTLSISTSPWQPLTHWKQLYLPLTSPFPCHPNETLHFKLQSQHMNTPYLDLIWSTTLKKKNKIINSLTMRSSNGLLDLE